jgi:hypothetical protein
MSRYYRSQIEGSLPPSLILDTYTNATVGYSLRKLRTAYTGNCIRVRRSLDNTEQDIGFNGSGNLDTISLLLFVGAGDGFVTTWYNQSGDTSNNNPYFPGVTNKTMVQTIAANQPVIVTSGVVNLKLGKPTIAFTSNKYLNLTTINLSGTLQFDGNNFSFFAVYEKSATGNIINFLGQGSGYLWLDYGGTQAIGDNYFSTTIGINAPKLISVTNTWTTSRKMYVNNSLVSTLTGTSVVGCDMSYMLTVGHAQSVFFSEIIMYRNDQITNISGINTAINTHYSIY